MTPPRFGAHSVVLCFAFAVSLSTAAERLPSNILFILADDLGWSDLGCYGNEWFATPHLDQLAAEGVRFTQAYAPAPICSASRAAFLTGKTTARLGFEFVTKDKPGSQPLDEALVTPPFTLNLALEEKTIAEMLPRTSYRTAFFGKWHLNQHYKRYLGWSPTHGPKAQGFEIGEEDRGAHPYSYWGDKTKRKQFLELPRGEFPRDTLTERAIEFLESDHGRKRFFLMVSHYFVHTPVHTRVRWLYEDYLERIPEDHPRREQLAHYGAMVTTLDHHVGQLLDALDEKTSGRTLVVFTSDNGGHPEYAGNAPLRGSKWNLYEGGIRVPMITRWGNSQKGGVCDVPDSGTDLFPTFVDAADVGNRKKKLAALEIDGTSIRSHIEAPEEAKPRHPREFLWHFPYYHPERGFAEALPAIGIDDGVTSQTRPHSALRSGDWKLIHFYEDGRDELYHLPSDPGEANDRSESERAIAEKLRLRLHGHLAEKEARLPVQR